MMANFKTNLTTKRLQRLMIINAIIIFTVLMIIQFGVGVTKVHAQNETSDPKNDSDKNRRIKLAKTTATMPVSIKDLIDWEIEGNQYFNNKTVENERNFLLDNQVVKIPHYDIPIKLMKNLDRVTQSNKKTSLDLKQSFATLDAIQMGELSDNEFLQRMDQDILKTFVFKKDNEYFFRWIKNPDDKKYHKAVEELLSKNGYDNTPKEYFTAFRTSSRSYILKDPNAPKDHRYYPIFSMKVSTNSTGGPYKDKGIDSMFIFNEKVVDDNVAALLVANAKKRKSLKILTENGFFTLKDIKHGGLIRSIRPYTNGSKMLPGFSVVHDDVGRMISYINKEKEDVAGFWNKNLVEPYAKAMAEFFALTGTMPSSPHSQNFYLQLDENFAPSGKVILKDFGDVYYIDEMVAKKDKKFRDYLDQYAMYDLKDTGFLNRILEEFVIPYKLFQEMPYPKWLTANQAKEWQDNFYKTYEKRFHEITGKRLIRKSESSKDGIEYYNYFLYANTPLKECFNKYNQLSEKILDSYIKSSTNPLEMIEIKGKSCLHLFKCTTSFVRKKDIEPPYDLFKRAMMIKGLLSKDIINFTKIDLDNYYKKLYAAYADGSVQCLKKVDPSSPSKGLSKLCRGKKATSNKNTLDLNNINNPTQNSDHSINKNDIFNYFDTQNYSLRK
ncbi:MAG: hypothetical protein HQK49_17810 [Oligoflexia bacterium]|nr:hypothetical protein [Oligoflexia bacterium]